MAGAEVWWQNYRKKRLNRETISIELITRKSFRQMLREYVYHSSVGIKKIGDKSAVRVLRVIWTIIFGVMFSVICHFMYYTWSDTLSKPFIVTMESSTYPISNIDFPAIAICNSNRISKKTLKTYVGDLHKHENYTLKDLEWFYIQHGRLLDYTWTEVLHMHKAMDYNSQYYMNSDKIITLMEKLSPKCEEMLLSCNWEGDSVNCMDIFTVRRTFRGHCCTFNYVMDYIDSPKRSNRTIIDVKKQNQAGYFNGLSVFLDPQIEDYVYPLNIIEGFDVLLFDSTHFPDPSGGRVIHRIVETNKAIFVDLQSVKQTATSEVRKYSAATRNCLFRDEGINFGNMYSYSACIVKCKINTVKSLCKCTPYFVPIYEYDGPICNFDHLKCLNKYKEMFLYIYPINAIDTKGLEIEIHDSLFCPECLPDCEFTQHSTRVSKTPLKIDDLYAQKQFKGYFSRGINLTNKCYVSIFQSTPDGNLDRLDVVSYWFEVLSTFGGFAGILIGFSIISLIELMYFLCIRFFQIIYTNIKYY